MITNIQDLAVEALNDLKAQDLVLLDVKDMTSLTDYMVICSGRSNRHVKSLAQNVVTAAKKEKWNTIRMEGEREGEWIIVDLGDVVVHVMTPDTRSFYQLEDLWEPLVKQREKSGS